MLERLKYKDSFCAWVWALLILIGLAMVIPFFAPYDPYEMGAERMLQSPSLQHWLGTDRFGRDIFSRILAGIHLSLQVAGSSVLFAFVVGTSLGIVAGTFRSWIDGLISRVVDVMFSIPDIILALCVVAILGPSLMNLSLAIGVIYTPIFARIARGSVLAVREELYVKSAKAVGVPGGRIMLRYILPNIMGPLLVQISLSLAFAILAEAALSYLGLGGEPDLPSWGMMLYQGKDWMAEAWWVAVFPGLAICLAVLTFNIVGDFLRDQLDPRS